MESTNQETSWECASPNDGFAGAPFFYSDLRVQEILTTIRYGVETRRGLILVCGDSGSGKTTLLFRAVEELPPHVLAVIVPSNTAGFADVLRLLRGKLEESRDAESGSESASLEPEALAVRRCQTLLRERLQRSELVALVIDDAHLLPDRTLRNLIHNFLGGSAESPDGALLQIILAGNRSLQGKLNQAALIPLRRRRPVVCEVRPLSGSETAAYVRHGLRAAHLPENLFDERALKRAALLSQGNPRAIHELCSYAVMRAGKGAVTAELIEAAAQKLEVQEKSTPGRSTRDDEAYSLFTDAESAPHRSFALSRPSLADEPAFFHSNRERTPLRWLRENGRFSDWLRPVTFLIVIVAAAALIPAEAAVSILGSWRAKVVELALQRGNVTDENLSNNETMPSEKKLSSGPSSKSMAGRPARQNRSEENATAEPDESPGHERARAPEIAPPVAPSAPEAEPGARRPATQQSLPHERDLQSQVAKAIASRAIMGVEVSVVQGTAILEGRVASERQRRAAERAALSVSGVERVRNRISISYG